jgi:hypothetical protein
VVHIRPYNPTAASHAEQKWWIEKAPEVFGGFFKVRSKAPQGLGNQMLKVKLKPDVSSAA